MVPFDYEGLLFIISNIVIRLDKSALVRYKSEELKSHDELLLKVVL